MTGNHGLRWAFTDDLPSSPHSGNHPDAADPGAHSMTFRAPSTDPSESDEILADAADDDEEVRGYVMQDVEAAAEESKKNPISDKDIMALDEEGIGSEDPEVSKALIPDAASLCMTRRREIVSLTECKPDLDMRNLRRDLH